MFSSARYSSEHNSTQMCICQGELLLLLTLQIGEDDPPPSLPHPYTRSDLVKQEVDRHSYIYHFG
jgi:hypothetical protein